MRFVWMYVKIQKLVLTSFRCGVILPLQRLTCQGFPHLVALYSGSQITRPSIYDKEAGLNTTSAEKLKIIVRIIYYIPSPYWVNIYQISKRPDWCIGFQKNEKCFSLKFSKAHLKSLRGIMAITKLIMRYPKQSLPH